MKISDQPNIQFIVCPACRGIGKNERGAECPNCAGLGMGTFWKGKFFYWGKNLSETAITARNLKSYLSSAINFAAYLIAVAGLVSLGWWFWQVGLVEILLQGNFMALGDFIFWRVKNPLILFFWISILADMFIVYRVSEERVKEKRTLIKKTAFREILSEKKESSEAALPNSWEELKKFKNKINVADSLSREGKKAIEEAYLLALKLKNGKVEPAHLFFSSLRDPMAGALFFRLNADMAAIAEKTKKILANLPQAEEKEGLLFSNDAKEVLIESYFNAMEIEQKKVAPINLIFSASKKDKNIYEVLYDLEVDSDKILNSLKWFGMSEKMYENYRLYRKMARFKPASNMDRAYTAVATPALNHFSSDLTLAAKWGRLELCVGRDKEIAEIFGELQGGASGIILVGPTGTGKKTIIYAIAQLMVEEDVPVELRDKRLLELDISRLVAGATAEEAQERLLVILDEAARAGNIVLYADNIEEIIGIQGGSEESLDLSDVLASALEKRSLYFFSSATDQNYAKYIEGTPLGNSLTRVLIKEPSGNQAIQIIESRIGGLEAKHKVYFSYNAIEQAVKLSSKYIHDKYLPAKAIEILEDVAVRAAKEKGEKGLVIAEDVSAVISEKTSIPITEVSAKESEKLLNLEEKIHERMIDQKEAVDMVAASLRRARVELREGKRPIASFLFLGPTGVGKTELAKTVAEVYFGAERAMIRLDMSEYQHENSVEKMIGASGETGYLTEAVRNKPFSLILLDEFEKAHPDILNLFLQVMDDGRLTDGQGRTIDFTNSIIIATSNAGAVYIEESIMAGVGIEEIKQALINEHLNKVMRPELINRFDGIVVFKPLSLADVTAIARLMLKKVEKMLEEKGIGLRVEEAGLEKLAQAGFDPKFGARPLRRVIQDKIENIIANKILAGELDRRDTVVIDEAAEIGAEKGREL